MVEGIRAGQGGQADAGGAPAPAPLRVAVFDRDSGFIQVLAKRMDSVGWEHRVISSPATADTLAPMRLDALLIDPAVADPRACEWLSGLCRALPDLAILVATGPSTVSQRVRGLQLGVDDWITKPCHPEEVIARIQSVVRRRRRVNARTTATPIGAGEIEIRSDHFQALAQGRNLDLTRREFELLELLAGEEGQVLEREEIYSRLWGYAMVKGDRSVDVFVRKLRQKLEKASPSWRYIHTQFGIGYRFAAEPIGQARPQSDPSRPGQAQVSAGISERGQRRDEPAAPAHSPHFHMI